MEQVGDQHTLPQNALCHAESSAASRCDPVYRRDTAISRTLGVMRLQCAETCADPEMLSALDAIFDSQKSGNEGMGWDGVGFRGLKF